MWIHDVKMFRHVFPRPFNSNNTFAGVGGVNTEATMEVAVDAPQGAVLEDCQWSIALKYGGGVWDDIPGVVAAKDWTPNGTLSTDATTTSTTLTVDVMFPSPGAYVVDVDCHFSNGAVVNTAETIKTYYVRRELRELNKVDRETFFDTFLTLVNTPTAEGIKLYGKHYRSLTDFQVCPNACLFLLFACFLHLRLFREPLQAYSTFSPFSELMRIY